MITPSSAAETPPPLSPLDGILIADFSRVLAGPLATMTLADLGARVIKVERPETGDDTRAWGPPFSGTGSTYFESVNRNKESMCLDLADEDDLALALTLAVRADVIVENFRPGTMDAVGLGYETVRSWNPRAIYVSITGFGSGGGAGIPGYDFVVQALGGLMSITGEPDDGPMKVGVALVDVITAKDVTIGVLAALRAREATGDGCRLELNLLSSLQGALANQAQAFLGSGRDPERLGNVHPSIAPYQTLACSDGDLAVACGNNSQFVKLVTALGIAELAGDPRFASNPERVRNREALVELLEAKLAGDTAKHWERLLTEAGVPAGHVRASVRASATRRLSDSHRPSTSSMRTVSSSARRSVTRSTGRHRSPRGERLPRLSANTTSKFGPGWRKEEQ
jgi:crotonobetainyl-CoA:carnitine CoA-transferase CaiB-like acyl-CoA transferase